MPAIIHPKGVRSSAGGQAAAIEKKVKDLSVNRTQSPNQLTVGAGGLEVIGAVKLDGGVTGAVSASGAVSGSSLSTGGGMSSGSVSTGPVSASSISASGAISTPSTLEADAGIRSIAVRSNVVVSGYAVMYVDGSGNEGVSSSSVEVKQDITPTDMSTEVAGILSTAIVDFRYIKAVEEYGANAPVERGMLAEYLAANDLGRYLTTDGTGAIDGIRYERLCIPLIATVQSLSARIAALEALQPKSS